MEECSICMNMTNNLEFVVLHKNSDHKTCIDCYKQLRDKHCPFCRCEIMLYNVSMNSHDLDCTVYRFDRDLPTRQLFSITHVFVCAFICLAVIYESK